MAYRINKEQCVNCGTCEPDCPVGAISEADNARIIDEEKCISCGTCAGECPTSAIAEV
ncbi:4Fe-4S binding protein [Treponema socranskii]|uniref:indolepyruvate ferredoxin oxidoreductase subunit alpha n=1 Tax=Treponema TaxID=157 RepID=UPI0016528102|nr:MULTISPECIES: 4Fe-4S binding protein [unclassified Treponema]MBC6720532.1 4Fe-4S binding protein [Treponema sp. Marseille-Q4130]MBM7023963.1 4Fe-4S binding protein [Treponema sp. Marseille-Q4523]